MPLVRAVLSHLKKIRSLSLFLGTVLPHLELQLSIVFLPGEDEVPLDAGLVLPGEHVLLLLGDGHVVPVVFSLNQV